MKQMNEMSARALSMEELEQVNLPAGGVCNPSSFLSQSPDFLKPGLFLGLVTGTGTWV